MPIQIGGTRSRRESWVLFGRGVTESGALDSSLSFLNRLSVGKAMAKCTARPGVKLQTQRLHRATTRLLLQGGGHMDPTQSPMQAPVNHVNEPRWAAPHRLKVTGMDACSSSFKCSPYYPSMCGIIWVIADHLCWL